MNVVIHVSLSLFPEHNIGQRTLKMASIEQKTDKTTKILGSGVFHGKMLDPGVLEIFTPVWSFNPVRPLPNIFSNPAW